MRKKIVGVLVALGAVLSVSPSSRACFTKEPRVLSVAEGLRDPQPMVRCMYLGQLGREWQAEYAPRVREMLLGDPDVRLCAAGALVSGQDPAAVSVLIDALGFEEDPGMRVGLARVLAETGSERATERIRQAALQNDPRIVAGGYRLLLPEADVFADALIEAYRCCGDERMFEELRKLLNKRISAAVAVIDAERRGAVTAEALAALRRQKQLAEEGTRGR